MIIKEGGDGKKNTADNGERNQKKESINFKDFDVDDVDVVVEDDVKESGKRTGKGVEWNDEQDKRENSAAEENSKGSDDDDKPMQEEGLFEIESIQKKRITKSRPEYFIKWRGWPDSDNTWEPLKHLEKCPNLVAAFEDSWKYAKSSKAKKERKRKYNSYVKKKPHGESSTDQPIPAAPLQRGIIRNEEKFVGQVNAANGSKQTDEGKEENDVDLINVSMTREGDHRSRKRKSDSMERCKKEPTQVPDQNLTVPLVAAGAIGSSQVKEAKNIRNKASIVKILEPIDLSTSMKGGVRDIDVSFCVLRTDGSKTIVTNKFMRIHYPDQLIDYYESNLQYCT